MEPPGADAPQEQTLAVPSVAEQKELIQMLAFESDDLGGSSYLLDSKWWILFRSYLGDKPGDEKGADDTGMDESPDVSCWVLPPNRISRFALGSHSRSPLPQSTTVLSSRSPSRVRLYCDSRAPRVDSCACAACLTLRSGLVETQDYEIGAMRRAGLLCARPRVLKVAARVRS